MNAEILIYTYSMDDKPGVWIYNTPFVGITRGVVSKTQEILAGGSIHIQPCVFFPTHIHIPRAEDR